MQHSARRTKLAPGSFIKERRAHPIRRRRKDARMRLQKRGAELRDGEHIAPDSRPRAAWRWLGVLGHAVAHSLPPLANAADTLTTHALFDCCCDGLTVDPCRRAAANERCAVWLPLLPPSIVAHSRTAAFWRVSSSSDEVTWHAWLVSLLISFLAGSGGGDGSVMPALICLSSGM